MVYEDKNANYALNSYVWKLLEANLEWDKADYEGATPIIPLAQQPELMQPGKPFLVYGSARHPSGHLYSLVKEAVSYTIYATSVAEVNRVANLLAETFERQDIAAIDVNEWLVAEGSNRGVHFGSIKTTIVEKAEPAEEEGGFYTGLVMLECVYTVDEHTIITSFNA